MGGMKTIRALAELRELATPGPLHSDYTPGHSGWLDSWTLPEAVRGYDGVTALNFENDWQTATFVEAAFNDLPAIADELSRAQEALERVEAEAAPYLRTNSALADALAELRAILSPDS